MVDRPHLGKRFDLQRARVRIAAQGGQRCATADVDYRLGVDRAAAEQYGD